MEQYWNSMWKNYTASMSRNSNGADFAADNTDGTESFINNDLHYKIPFWIGVIVISLLFVSAIIASIRYCYYMICSAAHRETEKVSLVPPRSPFLRANGVASHTLPRQQRPLNNGFICDSSIDEHSSSSSSTPEKCEGQTIANISNIPIIRPQLRPNFNATHTLPRHQKLDMEFEDSYFPSMETARTHISHEFRKKIQGVYVLPVSPALSSSSSTTNTDDMIKSGCSTMPIRSMRHISSSNNVQKDSSSNGVKNDCFTDSPLPKDRTLPRSHANTLRRVQAPAQPPPLPPVPSQMHSNTFRSFVEPKSNQMLFERRSTNVDVDPSEITLTFNNQTIYNTHREHPTKKASTTTGAMSITKAVSFTNWVRDFYNRDE